MIGVTGSTGKTSTKDLLLALLAPHRRTVASRANFNTEIGLPLEILGGARRGPRSLVLEMAMRGAGQIAELAAIAEPDVAVIVSVGPVHLELLGTVENVAAAKAELIAGLAPGAAAIVPAGERLLDPHLRADVRTVTFGAGGDVRFERQDGRARGDRRQRGADRARGARSARPICAPICSPRWPPRGRSGVTPAGRVELALSAGRGESIALAGGVTVIDGCYNANPMSMRAALSDLAATAARTAPPAAWRCWATCSSSGPERALLPPGARRAGGRGRGRPAGDGRPAGGRDRRALRRGDRSRSPTPPRPRRSCPSCSQAGDLVLVKGSLGVGLKLVCEALGAPGARGVTHRLGLGSDPDRRARRRC